MIATEQQRTDIGRPVASCRACHAGDLTPVLDLGAHAVSAFPADDAESIAVAPLVLVRCAGCGLVQLRHTVPRARLYGHYWYRSAVNESMVAALRDVAASAMAMVALTPGDVVIDIGCNDGTLLTNYPDWLHRVGVEPAANLANEARATGAEIVTDFFPTPDYRPPHKAKIITSIAQFYNVDEPHAYLSQVADWLADDGVFVVQFQDLDSMLAANAFDNICHEHLCHYDLRSLAGLLDRHGLRIVRAERNQVNGGSLRVYARKSRAAVDLDSFPPSRTESLEAFAARAQRTNSLLFHFLWAARISGSSVLGYAASTKANTLLQYCGITPDLLPAIADRNPEKVGRRTVATNIPIIGEAEMRAREPDYLLALAWHFIESFKERERPLTDRGTRWVVPLPEFRVLPC